jgi:cytochrome P450
METPLFVDGALEQLGRSTEPYVRQIVDEFIDEFAPSGRKDLVLRFARPVSLHVAGGLLGMDERYAAGVGQAVHAVLGTSRFPERAEANLWRLCEQLVEQKRAAPGPDLVSWMLHLAPPDLQGVVPGQVRRLLLGVVAGSAVEMSRTLSSRLPWAWGTTSRVGWQGTGRL